uniref:Uncharacterized protein n=1 Tax=Aegilops tauschii subsp. strangulata TaxID=200361 RepID=A0A453G4Y4_AEGTS
MQRRIAAAGLLPPTSTLSGNTLQPDFYTRLERWIYISSLLHRVHEVLNVAGATNRSAASTAATNDGPGIAISLSSIQPIFSPYPVLPHPLILLSRGRDRRVATDGRQSGCWLKGRTRK